MSLSRVLAMLPDKVDCIHAPWQRHQDTPSRPFPGRQAGSKGQQGCRPSTNGTERNSVQEKSANKKKQRRRNSSSFMDMCFWEENARYDCMSQKQGAPVPTGALSCTPPEGSGSPNHTLYLSKLITPKNADHLLFLWACGFVRREETLAVLENSSNYSPWGIQTVKWS